MEENLLNTHVCNYLNNLVSESFINHIPFANSFCPTRVFISTILKEDISQLCI